MPTGHEDAEYAQEEAPTTLYAPAAQLAQLAAPAAALKVPAGQPVQVLPSALNAPTAHRIGAAEPEGHEKPAEHAPQVAAVDAPRAALAVPAGQGVGSTEESGQ